ncbi:MAG: FHA domain-containing protein [Deltaproteobacteria bacterium]|nr:FHA domain-containing protein [Deltaproteobacteria bacterium]
MPEKKYEINGIAISIGRSDDNDVVLSDSTVSLRHAKIRFEGEKYFIYDLASTNGTRVNGRKIIKKSFKEGDIIEMGHTRMAFKMRENGDGLRKRRVAAHSRHLSGNLEYFDLPFIIQTLATSERTGTLTITDQLERVFATLYFEAGDVLFAKLGHLRGEEAFYQLFQSPVQDAFTFKGGLPSSEFKDEPEIGTTTTGLLMEAAREQDELKVMKATFADANRILRPQWEILLWGNEETRDLASEIWARLQRGETIAQMVREITVCEYRIYKVLSLMDANGFVE